MDNDPRTFVVLGAPGGIGSELCRRPARDGANLVLAARDEGRLQDLAEELDAPYQAGDATDGGAGGGLFSRVREERGGIAGAANRVGPVLLRPAHMTSEEKFARQISLDLTTAFNTVKSATRHMPDGGSVVLLSSVAARVGLVKHEVYEAAAKAGVPGLAPSAAASYAGRGLRFNVVSPGLVQTPITENIPRSETAKKASVDLHPLGRLGEPEDVAAAVAYLLDPGSGWVTRQTIGLDGGLSTPRPPVRRQAKA